MKQVLIIGSNKAGKVLGQLIVPRFAKQFLQCESGAKARRYLAQYDFDVVVIDSQLPDEHATGLALDIVHEQKATVILLCSRDAENNGQGIISLHKPIELPLLEQTLYTIEAAQVQLELLKEENSRLKKQLDEARLVGRAKCVLVAKNAMSESEAHRYIEKMAMDSRLPKRAVAQDILQACHA